MSTIDDLHHDAESGSVCPLCGRSDHVAIGRHSYSAIWNDLRRIWQADFSNSIVERHTPVDYTKLVQCNVCGLQYFIPMAGGDKDFYSELSKSPIYYSPYKWEFDEAKRFIQIGASLLDIGCGEGAFLRSICHNLTRAEGIDTNPVAVMRAQQAGLTVSLVDIQTFAVDHKQMYDVVTGFQVVEHMSEILPFCEAAMSCVKPGGMLIVSVPNRDRVSRQGQWEPLDCPPHHLTRWSIKQFHLLAEKLGGRLVMIQRQPLDYHSVNSLVRTQMAAYLKPYLDNHFRTKLAAVVARLLANRPIYKLYDKINLIRILGIFGHSMLAVIQKPRCKDGS